MKKCDCEYRANCPLWTRDLAGRLDHFFLAKYCRGQKTLCARWQLRNNGEEAPTTLLPNGILISQWLQNEVLIF